MTSQNNIKKIERIVKNNRLISDRVKALESLGFSVKELPMGSGGVLQRKYMANGEIRIQVGYGHSRYNYAATVVI